ncbi:MAG TPA: BON domain-containing protein [Thermoanaerobaculia bacterium]
MSKTGQRRAKVLCGAAIAIAVLGAAGCGSSEYARRTDADRTLSAQVGERLAADPALSAANVAARSHSGVVALVGEAPNDEARLEAERVAGAVPGVARVDNLILVAKGDSRAAGSAPPTGALFMSRTQ